MIAGRSYKEILSRYESKVINPRTTKSGKYSAKIIKEFLKIKTSLKLNTLNYYKRPSIFS